MSVLKMPGVRYWIPAALGMLVATINIAPLVTFVAIGVVALALYGAVGRVDPLPVQGTKEGRRVAVRLDDHQTMTKGARALFSGAERSIKIVAGWLGPAIFFNDEVFAACRRIIAGSGEISILVAEPERTRDEIRQNAKAPALWAEFENWERIGAVSFRKACFPVRPHFAVVDGAHIWDEDPHEPSRLGAGGWLTHSSPHAHIYVAKFEQLKKQSIPI